MRTEMNRVFFTLLVVALTSGVYWAYQGPRVTVPSARDPEVANQEQSAEAVKPGTGAVRPIRSDRDDRKAPVRIEESSERHTAARTKRLRPDRFVVVESAFDPDVPPVVITETEARRSLYLAQDDLELFEHEQDRRIEEFRRGGGYLLDGEAVLDEDWLQEDVIEHMRSLRDDINAERERIAVKKEAIEVYRQALE